MIRPRLDATVTQAFATSPTTSLPSSLAHAPQFYTKLVDLWAATEQIWEGAFCILAAIIIFLMGVAFLRMDRARVKWRVKLAAAFEDSHSKAIAHHRAKDGSLQGHDREGRGGKWALFLLPFITVLREGLEAVVFVGGVSGFPCTLTWMHRLTVVLGLAQHLCQSHPHRGDRRSHRWRCRR
jgi:high-affinity iron transporter